MTMTVEKLCRWLMLAAAPLLVYGFSVENSNRVFVSTPTSKTPKKLVADYMTAPTLLVSPDTSVDEAMELFLHHGITGAPVVDPEQGNTMVGILSSFDFLQKEAFEGSLLPMEGSAETIESYVNAAQRICGQSVADIMTAADDLQTVTAHTPMREAAAIMSQNKLHRLPVVEGSVLVGMLTAEHVIQDLMNLVRSLPPAERDGVEGADLSP